MSGACLLAVPAAAVVAVDLVLDWALHPVAAAVVLLAVLLELGADPEQDLPLPALLLELAVDPADKPLLLAQALLQVVAVLVPDLAPAPGGVAVELLLSRQSSSAAMARITT